MKAKQCNAKLITSLDASMDVNLCVLIILFIHGYYAQIHAPNVAT